MSGSTLVRGLAALVAAMATPLIGAALLGPTGLAAGSGLAIAVWLWAWLWLPRAAHRAFRRGEVAVAARRYRTLARLALGHRRQRAAWLSEAACELASDDPARVAAGAARLGETPPAGLDTVEEAVWVGNRAYAVLRQGDARRALELIDHALALRPDVAALQHTRGQALLAVGRIDEAIGVLDGLHALGELGPRLEAERCAELARAWAAKGEAAYAEDYRQRASRLAAR
jgi:predicted Zn-dependent protease